MDRNCLTLAGGIPGATRVCQPSPPESKRRLHSPVSPLGCDLKGRVTSASPAPSSDHCSESQDSPSRRDSFPDSQRQ